MALDAARLARELEQYMASHRVRFTNVARRDSQILEIGALCITTRHYEAVGYAVTTRNEVGGRFKVNTNARGRPWNFSYFELSSAAGAHVYEVYANLSVRSAYGADSGQYVVDVAVVTAGSVPTKRPTDAWTGTRNEDLVTFLEAKAIVIYPMLVAQFIGIVHEIKPRFLGSRRPRGFLQQGHFDPTLVSLGYVHGISAGIVNKLPDRKFHIGVVGHFDAAIRRVTASQFETPLARRG